MIDDSHFLCIEQDVFATTSGFGEKQDTTALTAAPSGNFVFKAHNIDTVRELAGSPSPPASSVVTKIF